MPIEVIRSHHTLSKLYFQMKLSVSRLMFGTILLIRQFLNLIKLLNILRKVLLTEISDGIPCLLYFCNLVLVLKYREVINPFPDLSNFPFDSKDVIFILSRMSNFDQMSKVTYLSLPLISMCFVILQRPQFFMFTARNKFSLPVNFPPRTSPSGVTMINRRWCYNC